MIQYQIPGTNIIRSQWQTVRRITNEILGVKGLIDIKLWVLPTWYITLHPVKRLVFHETPIAQFGGIISVLVKGMHDFAYKTFSPKKFLPIDVAVLNLIHDLYFQTDIPLGLSFHIIFCGSLEKVSAIIFSDESLSAPTTVPNDTKITPSSPTV